MMTRKDFKAIAKTLKDSNADIPTIEAFVKLLEEENPRFKPDLFRKASL